MKKLEEKVQETTAAPQTQPETPATTQPDTEAYTQPQTEAPTQDAVSSGKNEEVVFTGHYYATPTGKCYHYSAECAGENASEITAEAAKRLKPCGTCVE